VPFGPEVAANSRFLLPMCCIQSRLQPIGEPYVIRGGFCIVIKPSTTFHGPFYFKNSFSLIKSVGGLSLPKSN